VFNSVQIALKSLLGNKARSALTLLGIICGVASVVLVLSVSEGLKRDFEKTFEELGTNVVTVYGRYSEKLRKSERFTMDDVELLRVRCPSAEMLSPTLDQQWPVSFGRSQEDIRVFGVLPDFFIVRNYKLTAGQEITRNDVESKRRVAVMGPEAVKKLSQGRNMLGREIRINRETFIVKGVLRGKGEHGGWMGDDAVLIPLSTAQRMMGENTVWYIEIKARDTESVPALKDEIKTALIMLRKINPSDFDQLFEVWDAGQWQQESRQMLRTIVIFLTVIGGISLLIGGIGIMNIMLVSVMERIREIGIRKAVGATELDIMVQFLVEAVTLCTLGGVVGVALGWFGNTQIEKLPQFVKIGLSVKTCAIAISVSMAVGLVSGLWPAAKAARLNPIEALRRE
jgi:putative ABC transport system permease protein